MSTGDTLSYILAAQGTRVLAMVVGFVVGVVVFSLLARVISK